MDAFDAAYDLGGRRAAAALEQMYGGYGAYANVGLQTSAGRFRSLWQRRNASHLLDRHIFANLAASGIASQDALASPAYGPRDAVPSGRSRIWAGGFGSWAEQKTAENLSGYKWNAQGFALTPSVGIEYDRLRNDGWTESLSGNPALVANRFGGDGDDSLGVPLCLRFNKLIRFGTNGGYAVPEVRAAYVYQADNSRPSVNAGYSGAPGSAPMVGVNPGRSHWRLGAGVSGRFNERVDFRVDYDFDARSGFRGHNLLATVRVSF